MVLSSTCLHQQISLISPVQTKMVTKSFVNLLMMSHSQHWHLRLWQTHLLVSWHSSVCIPVHWTPVLMYSMQQKERKSVNWIKYIPEISQQLLVSNWQQQVILSVMRNIRLFWNPWNSLNRLSSLLSSRKQRTIRVKWVKLWQNLLKKIRHSVLILIRKPVRQSLPEWVSFTWKLS